MRFHEKKRENFLLEGQQLSKKLRNEKPLIWQSIGSFRALSWVRICVFLLISLSIVLDFYFELWIRLVLDYISLFFLFAFIFFT